MVTAARNRKKMLGCISGHESTISTSARTLSPTASPYQGRPGTAERRRRVSVCGAPSVSLDVCCVDSKRDRKGVIIVSPHQGAKDGPTQPYPTPRRHGRGPHRPVLPHRRRLRPPQPEREALRPLKRLADSEVIALALFQQLRGVESERSFLRDTERFFSHLFPGVV